MLPLLSRIFQSLGKPVHGTDDVVEQKIMRKAYLAFILNLLNNRMEAVFVSEGDNLKTNIHWLMSSESRTI
jgi:Exportin-T